MATVTTPVRTEYSATVQGCYDDWSTIRQNGSEDYKRGFYDGFREMVWMLHSALPKCVRDEFIEKLYKELDAEEPMLGNTNDSDDEYSLSDMARGRLL